MLRRVALFLFAVGLTASSLAGSVVLNEFVASNGSVNADEDGSFEDWIELYNAGPEPVNLNGWGLSDSPSSPFRWTFPERVLGPGQFLLVWASSKDRRPTSGPLHTNFNISAGGERLLLTRPDGSRADELAAIAVPRDASHGRQPDGSGAWVFFAQPTPAAANTSTAYGPPVAPPIFSAARGFYDDAFALTLSTNDQDAAIYYTTDGRAPSPTVGQRYSSPLSVTTTTVVRARAIRSGALPGADSDTHSYVFLEDVATQPRQPAGWPTTWGNWQFPHYEMSPSVTTDPATGPRLREALTSLPSLSLVLAPDDLFSSSRGLLANRQRQGDLWERAVSVEWLSPPGSAGADWQVNAALRTHGAASRSEENTPKSALRLVFKSEYGPAELDRPFFAAGGSNQDSINTIVLRADWNNSWLYPEAFSTVDRQRHRGLSMRDRFIRDLQIAMSGAGSHSIHVHLYLNGLYWGLYTPAERLDAAWAASYFGGEREEWDVITHEILGSGGSDTGERDGDRAAYDEMMSRARAGLTSEAGYAALAEMLDIPHFIDYILLNLWAGNYDWPHNNWAAIRRRAEGEKFRYFSWDAEQVMEEVTESQVLHANFGPMEIFQRLRANAEFRRLFGDRVHRHCFGSGDLTPALLTDRFARTSAVVEAAVIAESARWGSYYRDTFTGADFFSVFDWTANWSRDFVLYTRYGHWQAEHDRVLFNYLPQRTANLLSTLRLPSFGLYPTVTAPTVAANGTVLLPGDPVTLTAPAGQIYYTLDGSDPRAADDTPGGTLYDVPFALTTTATVRARVRSGDQWSALAEAALAVSPLTPQVLANGPYAFASWPAAAVAGSYPAHSIFEQSSQADPALEVPMDGFWTLPYDLGSRSRIVGLGDDGIMFINTGNTQDAAGAGYLGAFRLALDTRGETGLEVSWTAGTVTPNPRTYGLRLQARVGVDAPFTDLLDDDGAPFEYLGSATAGHAVGFGPVALPAALENQPYVELRWKYYYVAGTSGARTALRLDDVVVRRRPAVDSFTAWQDNQFPDPSDRDDPSRSGPLADPTGRGWPNLLAYALAPSDGAAPARPSALATPDGLYFTFRRDPTKADVAYVVEASRDLLDWSEVLYDSRLSPGPNNLGDQHQIFDPAPALPAPRFVRLRVVLW